MCTPFSFLFETISLNKTASWDLLNWFNDPVMGYDLQFGEHCSNWIGDNF